MTMEQMKKVLQGVMAYLISELGLSSPEFDSTHESYGTLLMQNIVARHGLQHAYYELFNTFLIYCQWQNVFRLFRVTPVQDYHPLFLTFYVFLKHGGPYPRCGVTP